MLQRILIIEDQKPHRDALCSIIEKMPIDIQIYCASNIAEASQLVLKFHIHLFIIDIVLDPLNPGDVAGLDFARKIREITEYKFTPLIFLTSLEDPELYSYTQLRCFSYIEKPFEEEHIRDIIKEALEFPLKDGDDKYVYFRKEGVVYSAYTKDIIYIECARRQMKIYCRHDEYQVPYSTCEEIMDKLDSDFFIQCSRYCIVNKRYIERIDYSNRIIKMRYIDTPVQIGIVMKKLFKHRMENE